MKQRSYFFFDVLDNTMLEYQRLQETQQGLICVRAGTQADGVGRSDKVWLSPPGGLWFTFDIEHPVMVPSFGLYVGYCLHHALSKSFAPLSGKLQIKWTNDIMYQGKKLGGLLCKHAGKKYIVGIGINTNNLIDDSLGKFGAVALKDILGYEVSNDELCRGLIDAVETHEKALAHEITYITYCNEHLFGRNCQVTIDVGTTPFSAEILGIDLHGALIIRKDMGEIVNLHAGSIMSVQAFS
jgi:BirA family transcriptional regulator, biotin operon repressor / biotin---[acetyl-CoA-carboxylase] ligase